VFFDGRPAFLISVTPGRIVWIAPAEIAGQAGDHDSGDDERCAFEHSERGRRRNRGWPGVSRRHRNRPSKCLQRRSPFTSPVGS